MHPITTTPFGQRPATADLIRSVNATYDRPAPPSADKWTILRDLCTARLDFGVSDRDLTVLNALLSFHPKTELCADDSLIVFPSNATLATRAHGMAESTLRRHLAALVAAGLVLRHDSPNGKRYARRATRSRPARAFGFDLRPLLVRSEEIATAAESAIEAAEASRRLREEASLLRRDAEKRIALMQQENPEANLADVAEMVESLRKTLRRKLSTPEIESVTETLREIMNDVRPAPKKVSGCDSHNERHQHSSNKESIDTTTDDTSRPYNLTEILEACPELESCTGERPRDWHQMISITHRLHTMIGIGRKGWEKAIAVMGPENTATVIACILQRFGAIRNPGGYLARLVQKAESGKFTPGPMITALLRAQQS